MASVEFDISELTDYMDSVIKFAMKEMPKETSKFMKKEATRLKNKTKRRAKGTLQSQPTGNYMSGFKAGKKVYEYSDAQYNVRVYNSAPHAHLIEYGHRMVTPGGRDVGFVPGRHIIENAAIAYESEFADHVENELAELIAEELMK